jgi:Flp pilus assembly protein TadD
MAQAALGRLEEIDRVIDACLTVTARSGMPVSVMMDAAYALRAHGHRDKALAVGERAISWLHSRSADELKHLRLELGQVLDLTEHWREAQTLFKELALEDPKDIEMQGYLGALAMRLGDRVEAERIAEALHALDARYRFGSHTCSRARIASLLGEREKAVALLREAFAQGYKFSISVHHDPDFEPLRGYLPFEELTKPKGL